MNPQFFGATSYMYASVPIKSQSSLHEIAALLSHHLFAGIPFGGENEGWRDEVPAMRTERDFLGWYVLLWGEDGEYEVTLDEDMLPPKSSSLPDIDASFWLAWKLSQVPGIQVVTEV